MIKLSDLHSGNVIQINDEGIIREGVVSKVSPEMHQAEVNNGVQDFWYGSEELIPIPLSHDQLMRLGFTKIEDEGGIKYKKESFRLVVPSSGDFTNIDMWWREDRRHFSFPLAVHELQNLYLSMTKSSLDMPTDAAN